MRTRPLLLSLIAALLVWVAPAAAATAPYGVRVVVLDAGHGGTDPGATRGKVQESAITLQMVRRVGRLIEEGMPGVKVVYTRSDGRTFSTVKRDDLKARARFANEAGGELLVSIHVNAAKSTAAYGVETIVMGETPAEQQYNDAALYNNNRDELIDLATERDAPIVRALIRNRQFTYGEASMALAQFIQQRYAKAGRHTRKIKSQLLRLLVEADMPSVLTEIGFLSNATESAYITSEKGQAALAEAIYRGIRDYSDFILKTRLADEGSEALPEATSEATPAQEAEEAAEATTATPATQPEPAQTAAPEKPAAAQPAPEKPAAPSAKVRYAIQIQASTAPMSLASKVFKPFKGKVKEYRDRKPYTYKYCLYECDTQAEAKKHLAEVRRTVRDAFIVRCSEGRIVH